MNISVSFPFTTKVYKAAFKTQLKRRKVMYYFAPAFGVFVFLGVLMPIITSSSLSHIQILGLVAGLTLVFYQPLIIAICLRQVKKSKSYGETITSTFSPDGFANSATGAEGRVTWNKIYEVIFSSAGILVFPQQGVFIFTPRSAFTSDSDYEAVKAMIIDAKVKVKKV